MQEEKGLGEGFEGSSRQEQPRSNILVRNTNGSGVRALPLRVWEEEMLLFLHVLS